MSVETADPASEERAGSGSKRKAWKRRRARSRSSLFAAGEPMVWLTGGALVLCIAMVVGLLSLVLWRGLITFWPLPVEQVSTFDGRSYMGEVTRTDVYRPEQSVIDALSPELAAAADSYLAENEGTSERRLFRTGNFRLTQNHFSWVDTFALAEQSKPEWVFVVERLEWGRFYGFPEAFLISTPVDSVEEARKVAEDVGSSGGELKGVVSRWADGREEKVLLPLSELDTAEAVEAVAEVFQGPEAAWQGFRRHHDAVRERWNERRDLEEFDTGAVNHELEATRLSLREAQLDLEKAEATKNEAAIEEARAKVAAREEKYEETTRWAESEFTRIRQEIDAINQENARYQLFMRTAGEGTMPAQQAVLPLDEIVNAYPANRISFVEKLGVYLGRWYEFLVDEPREANSEGGVFPAIFGTVTMTLIMSLVVVPFGVLAALYLREYAKSGPLVSAVRIAVNNLAGVPSIVFGVFGLGFFCYLVGASIDELFFAAQLPNPTYGKGGLLWASLTLALLTLPVVIVATEEAVSAVPNSMREGSYACGASKWQTIQRIVLPRALPGIITGMILAIARGAGEVAPLMLVGAVKLAPELPIDGVFPYIHPERSFMHLGFHIFDVGFQSQNSEAAKPMVFTTTLLLIGLIALLNFAAIRLRNSLRKKYAGGQF